MQERIETKGIILKNGPVGESDRRMTILTNTMGKISAFARGARKPNSRFSATTGQFVFGTFKLFAGRDSYTVAEVEAENYFETLMTDVEGACYGSYFCEIADYYCRENNDEREMMKLLYVGLTALTKEQLPNPLVRAVFECKALVVNGEFPGVPTDRNVSDTVAFTLDFIAKIAPEKVFSFTLTEEAQSELIEIADFYRKRFMDRQFKSLEILNTLC